MTDSTEYEQILRAERAEQALAAAEKKLARVLEMADAWESHWGEGGIKASMAAAGLRVAILGRERV